MIDSTRRAAAILAMIVGAAASHAVVAQPRKAIANAGTLTCVVSPDTPSSPGVERKASCDFAPIVGPRAKLEGVIKRIGKRTGGQGKVVLVWSVLAPEVDVPVANLVGRYVGKLGAAPLGSNGAIGLIGGHEQSIRLRPLTADPKPVGKATLSVLELELSAMKA